MKFDRSDALDDSAPDKGVGFPVLSVQQQNGDDLNQAVLV